MQTDSSETLIGWNLKKTLLPLYGAEWREQWLWRVYVQYCNLSNMPAKLCWNLQKISFSNRCLYKPHVHRETKQGVASESYQKYLYRHIPEAADWSREGRGYIGVGAHSIQSDRLSLQSSELGPPIPSPAREYCSSLLWVQWGRHMCTCLRGR
jgi:hypothetical protein